MAWTNTAVAVAGWAIGVGGGGVGGGGGGGLESQMPVLVMEFMVSSAAILLGLSAELERVIRLQRKSMNASKRGSRQTKRHLYSG
jgi:hypothetical protein